MSKVQVLEVLGVLKVVKACPVEYIKIHIDLMKLLKT